MIKDKSKQHARDWLHSLPITFCGTVRLSDEALFNSGIWFALGYQYMQTTHLCLQRICLREGQTRFVLFTGFWSCGSTWCAQWLNLSSFDQSWMPICKGTTGLAPIWRQTTRRHRPHSMESRQNPGLGRHGSGHAGTVLPCMAPKLFFLLLLIYY